MQYTAPPQPRGGGRRPEGFKSIIQNELTRNWIKFKPQKTHPELWPMHRAALELVSTQPRTISTLLRKNDFCCTFLRWIKICAQSHTIRTLLRKNHFCCAALRWSKKVRRSRTFSTLPPYFFTPPCGGLQK